MQKHLILRLAKTNIYRIDKKLINLSLLQTIYAGELSEVIILL